ncbi:MAG: 50S ribosomal protein L25 [Acidimicrobiales bacterium]|tara:strand:+ start:273 stop:956 length:684 start_codon:yes stop_codon:yes gene_type:complete
MEEIVLAADTGRNSGTRSSKRLRTTGSIPGVLYGLSDDSIPLSVKWPELRLALTTDAGVNAVIQLEVDGERHMSIVKDLQRHPVKRDVIHVDFLRIDPNQKVTVDVPVIMIGDALEVTQANGMVDQNLFSLTVDAPPMSIPNEFEIDISNLTVGDAIRVADIGLPEGVTTEADPEETVAVGMITRSTLEAMAAEEAAAAEGEEGEEGQEGGAEASSEDQGDSEDSEE